MVQAQLPLKTPLDPEGLRRFGEILRRSFDVETIDQDAGSLTIRVRDNTSATELQRNLSRILRSGRTVSDDVLFVHDVEGGDNVDAQPELEAVGQVCNIGPGLFAFSGDFLRVRTALDARIRDIASRAGAHELAYPALWPVPLLQGIDYFHDFPHLTMVAAGVTPTYEARAAFADRFRKNSGHEAITCTEVSGLAPAVNALAPTVCDCCYWLLRERGDVADQMHTIVGQVFRNESSADGRIDRLTSYTMREIVMIGSETFVMDHREALLDEVTQFMVSLDLACRIKAADDPFFCNDALKKTTLQNLALLKFEVEVPLFGDRRTAVASINLHNDFFSRNYNYRSGAGGYPFSACVAFGYERLTYALFCRHGVNTGDWPDAVRQFLALD